MTTGPRYAPPRSPRRPAHRGAGRAVPARAGPRPRGEDGMVAAEAAAALPAVVLVLALGLGAVGTGVDTVRCVDAARAGARAAARGDDGTAAARRAAPGGADVVLTRAGRDVRVDVVGPVRPLTGWLPRTLRAHAQAVALVEDAAPAVSTPDGAP